MKRFCKDTRIQKMSRRGSGILLGKLEQIKSESGMQRMVWCWPAALGELKLFVP
jgi:hypothetical protein